MWVSKSVSECACECLPYIILYHALHIFPPPTWCRCCILVTLFVVVYINSCLDHYSRKDTKTAFVVFTLFQAWVFNTKWFIWQPVSVYSVTAVIFYSRKWNECLVFWLCCNLIYIVFTVFTWCYVTICYRFIFYCRLYAQQLYFCFVWNGNLYPECVRQLRKEGWCLFFWP